MASTFKDLITNTNYFLIEKRDMYRLGELAKQYDAKDWEVADNKRIYEITFNEALAGLESKLSAAYSEKGEEGEGEEGNKPLPTKYTTFVEGTESNFTTDNSAIIINDYAFYNFSQLGGENRPLTFNAASAMGSHAFEKCVNLETIYGNKMANIGSFAFVGCKQLTNVEFLPKEDQQSSIKRGVIEEQAFANCSSLEQFNSPNFNKINSSAFLNCSNLKELYAINADAEDTALVGCTALTSLSLGYIQKGTPQNGQTTYKGLNTVAGLRFTAAPNLQTINLPGILSLSGHTTSTSNTIAFLSMKNLQQATFKNLKSIGSNAFRGCTGLTTIKGIDNVITLGSYTFANCTALTTCGDAENQVKFPNIRTIPSSAFINCSAITTASFPIAETIHKEAFKGCTNLSTLYAPDAILNANDAINTCANLTDVTLGIETLAKDIFSAAQASLKTLNLPKATTIKDNFQQANIIYSALTTLIVPKVNKIGDYAFSGCYKLTSLNLPQQTLVKYNNKEYSNTTTIGKNAFRQCDALTKVTISAENITIDQECFFNCGKKDVNPDPEKEELIGLQTFEAKGLPASTDSPYKNNTMTFNQGAFLQCNKLSSVTIGYRNSGDTTHYTKTVNIGANAFAGCTKLTNDGLRIAASNITIGGYAFSPAVNENENVTYDHPQLTEINNTIFNGDNITIEGLAFASCDTIKNIKLTNATTTIKHSAFTGCNLITSIDISGTVTLTPETITKVTYSPFQDITNLNTITLNNLTQNTPQSAFLNVTATTLNINGTVSRPATAAFSNSSFTNINIKYLSNPNGYSPFQNCDALTNLTIGLSSPINKTNLLKNAGKNKGFNLTINGIQQNDNKYSTVNNQTITVAQAFAGTNAITMNFPNLTSITAEQVFYNNAAMTTFTADNLTSLPKNTFQQCTALTALSLPHVSTIVNTPFTSCTALKDLTLGGTEATINEITNHLSPLTNLETATIYATTVGNTGFSAASNSITTINLPITTTVQGSAFTNCTKLTTLTLPKVTTISGTAFNGTKFNTTTPYTLELSALNSIVVKYQNNAISDTPFKECHNFSLKLNELPTIYRLSNNQLKEVIVTDDNLPTIFANTDFSNKSLKCYILLPKNIYNNVISEGGPWTNLNLSSY